MDPTRINPDDLPDPEDSDFDDFPGEDFDDTDAVKAYTDEIQAAIDAGLAPKDGDEVV